MSTVKTVRYVFAAAAALTAVGLMINGDILTGVICLVGAVLLLPILYEWMYITSNEVQFLSPAVILCVAFFSCVMLDAIPPSYEAPLKTVYSTSSSQPITTTTTIVMKKPILGDTVYYDPRTERYHLNSNCGGEDSYMLLYDVAFERGYIPCDKCISG